MTEMAIDMTDNVEILFDNCSCIQCHVHRIFISLDYTMM